MSPARYQRQYQKGLKILEDSSTRAKERLSSAEAELKDLDGNQESKRKARKQQEKELATTKKKIGELEREDLELSTKEENLGKQHKELLVRFKNGAC